MDDGRCDPVGGRARVPVALKILVAGGFGAGKTTLVGSVSEIQPLRTEEVLTDRSVGVDDMSGIEQKSTTTVALDFGRITIQDDLVLYLFGTPGQDRFWFLWDELAHGAVGADVRSALDLDPAIPVLLGDVRHRESGKELLIALVERVLATLRRSRRG